MLAEMEIKMKNLTYSVGEYNDDDDDDDDG